MCHKRFLPDEFSTGTGPTDWTDSDTSTIQSTSPFTDDWFASSTTEATTASTTEYMTEDWSTTGWTTDDWTTPSTTTSGECMLTSSKRGVILFKKRS